MIYKTFQNDKISALGLGTMRLPTIGGDDAKIDKPAAKQMVAYAFEKGINYFDTAWGYHSGQSELVMGEILSEYPRESFYLASKFPGYDLANMSKVEEIFERQLEKCQVEYFDFYLFHNLCEKNIDGYLDPKNGILDYLLLQKKNGRIRHLGFSVHGTTQTTRRFLDAYGEYMEFGQIQLNYLDWDFQAAKEKVAMLNERNIPIWVMEPLRGGKLAALPKQYVAMLGELSPGMSEVEWAFRYLQSVPGVTVTLSGMSSFEQLRQNIEIFQTERPLGREQNELLFRIASDMTKRTSVPCTACRYCVSHCPQGLDIPRLLELYNEHTFTKDFAFIAPMAVSAMPEDKRPSACIQCRSCEAVCPQKIKVSEILGRFAKNM